MESIDTDMRKIALKQWLLDCGLPPSILLQPMINDASFRRYFRVYTSKGTFVAMDAPPTQENCAPYVAIAKALKEMGVHVPQIIYENIGQGFLLVSDLGDVTLLTALNSENADHLYTRALKTLGILQSCKQVPNREIPLFTYEFMWQEWLWHKDWFLGRLLRLNLTMSQEKELDQCLQFIVESATKQPQVFMHRDFHSGNLMLLANEEVGVLDFQDAFIGPITYDLASLLRDCYIDWPVARVNGWALNYWQQLQKLGMTSLNSQEFLCWFDWMSIQRHLKALFTFTRKHLRDEHSQYLKYVPRTLNYLLDVSRSYTQLAPFYDYYASTVRQAFEQQVKTLCVA